MKLLKPLPFKDEYALEIEKYIIDFFKENFYAPIVEIIQKYNGEYFNSNSALYDAVINGLVQYIDGKFYGKFNSKISKELREIGAKYSKTLKRWIIAKDKVPLSIIHASAIASSHFKMLHEEITEQLDLFDADNVTKEFDIKDKYDKNIDVFNVQVDRTLKDIEIIPSIPTSILDKISKDYNENMKLYIKDFLEQEIKSLRTKVSENSISGYRADNLIKTIQANYNVSLNKAKFLARQETSLFFSKFKENKYKNVGIRRYKWSTSNDERVRDRHAALNGKIYSWDEPPIVDDKGNRKNPGEDFGCRCVAVPILEF